MQTQNCTEGVWQESCRQYVGDGDDDDDDGEDDDDDDDGS